MEYEEYFDSLLVTEILKELKVKDLGSVELIIKRAPSYFEYISDEIFNKKDAIREFMAFSYSSYYNVENYWKYVDKEILSDKEFMIEMIQKGYVYQFGFLDSELQNDTDVQKIFIQTSIDDGLYFRFKSMYPILDEDLKEMVKQAYIQHINDEQTPSGYNFDGIDQDYIPDELRNDADFMLELLKKGTSTERIFFEDVSSELANNREFVLSVLENTDADVNYDNIGLDIFKDAEVMDKIDLKLREREERARQQRQVLERKISNPKVEKLEELEVLETKIDELTEEAEHVLDKSKKKARKE